MDWIGCVWLSELGWENWVGLREVVKCVGLSRWDGLSVLGWGWLSVLGEVDGWVV